MKTTDKTLRELTSLFFTTRQIIRAELPGGKPNPNAWLRFETLRFIAELREPTMQDIARHLRVRAPSATSLVRNLVSAGLAARCTVRADKRVVRIQLTRHGVRALAAYQKRSTAIMHKVFSKLGKREIWVLASILRRLRDIHRADASARR